MGVGVGVSVKSTPTPNLAQFLPYGSANQRRANHPLPMPYLIIMPGERVFDYVLRNCGATLPTRDPADTRIVEQVRTGIVKYNEAFDDTLEIETPPYIRSGGLLLVG